MARSTLELLLESIKTREEQPPDELPRLPQRPPSRARLPSPRGRATLLLLGDRNGGSSNGHASLRHSSDADSPVQKVAPTSNGCNVQQTDTDRFSVRKDGDNAVTADHASQPIVSVSQSSESLRLGMVDTSGAKKRKTECAYVWSKGSRVWFLNQESRWTQGVIQSVGDMDASVSQTDGQVVIVKHNWICPANPDILDDVDDLVHLSYVNEPSILHVLRRRYGMGKPYTRAGLMLISTTSSTRQQSYEGNVSEPQKQSHHAIYALIDSALEAVKRDGMNQSIILSGENDAEKMELMKSMVQYLASHGQNAVLGNMLLALNTILEAFVCANVSYQTDARYMAGMINLHYDSDGKLLGADWQSVLLDKSMFASQDREKRLYKIFYLLCDGANSDLKEKLNMNCTREFSILKDIDDSNSSAQFQSVIDSLLVFGINHHDQHYIFTMLAAILWLGNITSPALNNEAFENAAKLLKCSKEELLGAFCNAEHDPLKMVVARSLIAQSIYERLILWLMHRINKVLRFETSGKYTSISVIKMPGFRLSQRKGLDDLLVNYSYEYLQQFIQHYLVQTEEQDIISGKHTVVSLQTAVIEFLEQEFFPSITGATESGLSQILETLLSNSVCCKQKNDHEFSVLHSFQEVTYDATFFLNGGYLFDKPQVQQIINSCMLWASDSNRVYNQYKPDGNIFLRCQEWVKQMMQTLEDSVPHFVLSLVPNELDLTNSFHEGSVLKQLQLNRVPETIIALKTSCVERISQNLFASRFGVLLMRNVPTTQDALTVCIEVLQKLNIPPYLYRVGLKRIFFYPGQIDKLNQARMQLLYGVIAVQKSYRGYRVRQSFKRQKRAVLFLQAVIRGWRVRKYSATQIAYKNEVVGTTLETKNIDEENISKGDAKEENGFATIVVGGNAKEESCIDRGLDNDLPRKDQPRGQDEILAALQRREEENAMLQQSIKEYERKWIVYEAKMKSMEEMWMKQMSTLQESLSAANKSENPTRQQDEHNEKDSSLQQSFSENVEANTPHHESNASREPDAARSMIFRLSKELDHRTQVFNDDANFLVEVKSGQIEANFKPDEELYKLKQRFEAWKKDFKSRLKDTKNTLKKLGKPESADKKKKKWWGIK